MKRGSFENIGMSTFPFVAFPLLLVPKMIPYLSENDIKTALIIVKTIGQYIIINNVPNAEHFKAVFMGICEKRACGLENPVAVIKNIFHNRNLARCENSFPNKGKEFVVCIKSYGSGN